jgi:hypothetical protein
MRAKRKNQAGKQVPASATAAKQQFAQARQAHAKGTMCVEDYIWTAMQCYAAEMRGDNKPSSQHFA